MRLSLKLRSIRNLLFGTSLRLSAVALRQSSITAGSECILRCQLVRWCVILLGLLLLIQKSGRSKAHPHWNRWSRSWISRTAGSISRHHGAVSSYGCWRKSLPGRHTKTGIVGNALRLLLTSRLLRTCNLLLTRLLLARRLTAIGLTQGRNNHLRTISAQDRRFVSRRPLSALDQIRKFCIQSTARGRGRQ